MRQVNQCMGYENAWDLHKPQRKKASEGSTMTIQQTLVTQQMAMWPGGNLASQVDRWGLSHPSHAI